MYHASSRENQLIYATTQSGWNVAAAIEALRGLNVGTSAGGTSTIPATDDDDGVLLLRAMLPEVSTDVLCEMYEQSGHRQAANPRNKTCLLRARVGSDCGRARLDGLLLLSWPLRLTDICRCQAVLDVLDASGTLSVEAVGRFEWPEPEQRDSCWSDSGALAHRINLDVIPGEFEPLMRTRLYVYGAVWVCVCVCVCVCACVCVCV